MGVVFLEPCPPLNQTHKHIHTYVHTHTSWSSQSSFRTTIFDELLDRKKEGQIESDKVSIVT